jgi:phenylalanyl-tRNA synthetase beta subunit
MRWMFNIRIGPQVELFDEFTHPKTGRKSKAFHVVFRSPERTLTNDHRRE